MAKNRFKIQQQLEGTRASLKEAVNKVDAAYADVTSTLEQRAALEEIVKDLKNRVEKYENELKLSNFYIYVPPQSYVYID